MANGKQTLDLTNAASTLDYDSMDAGGLVEKFDGTIIKARYMPWTYPNKSLPHYMDAAAITYRFDPGHEFEGKETHTEMYGCGTSSLQFFVPSMDGKNPSGVDFDAYMQLATNPEAAVEGEEGEFEGIVLIRQPTCPPDKRIIKSCKLAEYAQSLKRAGVPDEVRLSPRIDSLEGIHGSFTRIKSEGFQGEKKEGQRDNKILVLNEFLGMVSIGTLTPTTTTKAGTGTGTGTKKATGAPASTGASAGTSSSDFEKELSDNLSEIILTLGAGEPISKSLVGKELLERYKGNKDLVKAVGTYNKEPWLSDESRPWTYDKENNTLAPKF